MPSYSQILIKPLGPNLLLTLTNYFHRNTTPGSKPLIGPSRTLLRNTVLISTYRYLLKKTLMARKSLSLGGQCNRDELLVFRKILTDLLDKEFIRVSNSAAAAPVLLAHKPGGGVRFCVDYRALNKITIKDRYPLPLISETLRNIAKAKWYTKLDVIAVFYQMRIAKEEKWKTAFRIQFGLYE
jgi:hypothetical protein